MYLVILVLALTISRLAEGMFEIPKIDTSIQSYWDALSIERTVNQSCECGKPTSSQRTTPWNLFVHSQGRSGSRAQPVTCIATIIASNLAVTSHRCILIDGKMRHHDILRVYFQDEGTTIADVKDISLTDTYEKDAFTIKFAVDEVIFNPRYAASSEYKMFPENDVAILKIEGSFFSKPELAPICVPSADIEDIGNVTGFYYNVPMNPSSVAINHSAMVQQAGRIFEKRFCQERVLDNPADYNQSHWSFYKTLCFVFDNYEDQTKFMTREGGPIIVMDPQNRTYLVGLAAVIGELAASGFYASIGIEKIFASSIKWITKFLEYYGDRGREKTTWCETPELKFGKKIVPRVSTSGESLRPWRNNTQLGRDKSLDCVCGLALSSKSLRISGGHEAQPREYSWMVQLRVRDDQKRSALCGGSVINSRLILTAAHCVIDDAKIYARETKFWALPEDIDATIFSHLRNDDPESQQLEISAVLFHPDYIQPRRDYYYDYDVALLILAEDLPFTKSGPGLRPVCLPENGHYEDPVGETGKVIGWGYTDPDNEESSLANRLMEIDVPVIPMSKCRSAANYTMTDNFLCAGTLDKYHDSAQGDSGGPLMIQEPTYKQWTEFGLVSHAYPMEIETPALYTDIQKVLDFIEYHSMRVKAKWCLPASEGRVLSNEHKTDRNTVDDILSTTTKTVETAQEQNKQRSEGKWRMGRKKGKKVIIA